jgi:hypothetical protein
LLPHGTSVALFIEREVYKARKNQDFLEKSSMNAVIIIPLVLFLPNTKEEGCDFAPKM